jgi:hypothetical protein
MATFGAVSYLASNVFWGFGSMFIMAYFIRPYVVPRQGYYYDNNDDDFQMPSTQTAYNPATGLPCLSGEGGIDVGGHMWGYSD